MNPGRGSSRARRLGTGWIHRSVIPEWAPGLSAGRKSPVISRMAGTPSGVRHPACRGSGGVRCARPPAIGSNPSGIARQAAVPGSSGTNPQWHWTSAGREFRRRMEVSLPAGNACEFSEESVLPSGLRRDAFAARRSGGTTNARVAELVDALDSGSSGGNPVEVRVLSRVCFHFQ